MKKLCCTLVVKIDMEKHEDKDEARERLERILNDCFDHVEIVDTKEEIQ